MPNRLAAIDSSARRRTRILGFKAQSERCRQPISSQCAPFGTSANDLYRVNAALSHP